MTAEPRDVAAVPHEPAGFAAAATAGECVDACDGRASGAAVVRAVATAGLANATDDDRPGGSGR
ncbi:hypothetical protein [Halomicrococcus gelatinilyticus]|uniref:hypothetical protein n=1 Tax=Halomicrococcus gelatinilyticus TaxID=1702103 RepID=UPI002E112B2F